MLRYRGGCAGGGAIRAGIGGQFAGSWRHKRTASVFVLSDARSVFMGQRKSRRSTGRLRIDRRPVSGEGKARAGQQNRQAPDSGALATPEGLVDLEIDVAGAQPEIAQGPGIEAGKLLALPGATA